MNQRRGVEAQAGGIAERQDGAHVEHVEAARVVAFLAVGLVTEAGLHAQAQLPIEEARQIGIGIEQPWPIARVLEGLGQIAQVPQRSLRIGKIQIVDPGQALRQRSVTVEQLIAQADLELRVQPAIAADDEINRLIHRHGQRRRLVDQGRRVRLLGRLDRSGALVGRDHIGIGRGRQNLQSHRVRRQPRRHQRRDAFDIRRQRALQLHAREAAGRDLDATAALRRHLDDGQPGGRFEAHVQLSGQIHDQRLRIAVGNRQIELHRRARNDLSMRRGENDVGVGAPADEHSEREQQLGNIHDIRTADDRPGEAYRASSDPARR